MRLRRQYKNYKRSEPESNTENQSEQSESELGPETPKAKIINDSKPVKPFRMIRQFMNNPNFTMQLMVIILSLASDNIQMDRRIDGMTTTIDKVRNITELVNNGMQSMKMVTEVPKSIRRILE
jgi:hypothetical protein